MLTLWKSLVLPRIEYCSQLWNPDRVGEMQMLENIQRSFTRKISGLQNIDYWDRLKFLKLYSLERRRERYIVIYIWKILENLVPNICTKEEQKVYAYNNARLGRLCHIPGIITSAPKKIQNLRENSLSIKGSKLFNCLPKEIRNTANCPVDIFKRCLDKYLATIPDQPAVPQYVGYIRAKSNRLQDQISAKQTDWTQKRVVGGTPV